MIQIQNKKTTTCELTTRKKRHHSSANLDHIHLKTVKQQQKHDTCHVCPPSFERGKNNLAATRSDKNDVRRSENPRSAAPKEQRRALQMLELIEEDEEMEESEPPEAPAVEPEAPEAAPEHGVLVLG